MSKTLNIFDYVVFNKKVYIYENEAFFEQKRKVFRYFRNNPKVTIKFQPPGSNDRREFCPVSTLNYINN